MSSVIRSASCSDQTPEPAILSVKDARERILGDMPVISAYEKLGLRDALGRVLAEDVISPLSVPGHTNSAMDGYALAGNDLPGTGERSLEVIGKSYAGAPFAGACEAGQCVRIMTGAVMPAGTDTVVIQEHVLHEASNRIRIDHKHNNGQNVRQAGEDIQAGDAVMHSSHSLTPADIGILASLGIGEVKVRRRPRVAFFSTGDELRSIGDQLGHGEVYDSNRYSLYGMLKRMDVEILDMGVVRDNADAVHDALTEAANMADVVITSGGVSVGEADYIKSVLEDIGNIDFWKIAMKPGRPLTYGRVSDARFFGLPGNPVAVMVTFYQFVRPALEYMINGAYRPPLQLTATSTTAIRKRAGRFEFQRGIYQQDETGKLSVGKTGKQGSGVLMSMSKANCFILLPEDCDGIAAGDPVTIQPFDTFV